MEHRWGERVGVDLPVKVTAHPFSVRHGRLINLSVSGASIEANFDLRLLSRIHLVIELPNRNRCESPSIDAYVARSGRDSIGIEWCEFAPPVIAELLKSISARRYMRLHRFEPTLGVAFRRLSEPLLKHGT